MNRRGFLGALATLAAGHVLDPERLLWVPGAKTIFLPSRTPTLLTIDLITREALRVLQNQLTFVTVIHRQYEDRWCA
jgi:hypothetical protein